MVNIIFKKNNMLSFGLHDPNDNTSKKKKNNVTYIYIYISCLDILFQVIRSSNVAPQIARAQNTYYD